MGSYGRWRDSNARGNEAHQCKGSALPLYRSIVGAGRGAGDGDYEVARQCARELIENRTRTLDGERGNLGEGSRLAFRLVCYTRHDSGSFGGGEERSERAPRFF